VIVHHRVVVLRDRISLGAVCTWVAGTTFNITCTAFPPSQEGGAACAVAPSRTNATNASIDLMTCAPFPSKPPT
jgi:hypothetical protein